MMLSTPPPSPSVTDGRRDWLAALLLQRSDRFIPRLAAAVAQWRDVGRGARRRLRAAVSGGRSALAAVALLLAMSSTPLLVPPAHAAAITVNDTCTLVDAIKAANTDTASGGCDAGNGADVIELQTDVVLTAAYISNNGTPPVTTDITIQGNGHTISRDPTAADSFRIFSVWHGGDLALENVTVSGGQSGETGGAVNIISATLHVIDSTITGNHANGSGGGIFNSSGHVAISGSTFYDNSAGYNGGGVVFYGHGSDGVIESSTFDYNEAVNAGGAVANIWGEITIRDSTFSRGQAFVAGGLFNRDHMTIVNSTLSGNSAKAAGGIHNQHNLTLVNSTVTGNAATDGGHGGGVSVGSYSNTNLSRNIISGNTAPSGAEISVTTEYYYSIEAGIHNVFGHAGLTDAEAFANFTPGGNSVVATSGSAYATPLSGILDTTLADNGGPTLTHNLVPGSPALDMAPDAHCDATDPNAQGFDQRGFVRPVDVPGQGNDAPSDATCDAGAVEYAPPLVFVSAAKPGTAGNAAFDNSDILKWDGEAWSVWFDGSDALLAPKKSKHNVNAFWIPDAGAPDAVMSFAQNARKVGNLPDKVDGTDLVWWDGEAWSLWFDGSDVGLDKKGPEKIDGLHALPGDAAPEMFGGSCAHYLLVSTKGPGAVPQFGGGTLKFSGEDVLGFCMTNTGEATAGFWHMVVDGSAEGVKKNAIDSISLSADGGTLYVTSKGAFNVDAASGNHSSVYAYDMTSGEFSGPLFVAADNGLTEKVDGLQME